MIPGPGVGFMPLGTAVREALTILRDAGATPAGIVIALDRQERMGEDDPRSAAQAVAQDNDIRVISVASLSDLLAFVGETDTLADQREHLHAYRVRYGSTC